MNHKMLISVAIVVIITICAISEISETTDGEGAEITFSDVTFDPDSDVLTFSGTSASELVNFRVEGDNGYLSQITATCNSDGTFNGQIHLESIQLGKYQLVAFTDSNTKITYEFSVDRFVKIKTVNFKDGTVAYSGTTSESLVNAKVSGNGLTYPVNATLVKDGSFSDIQRLADIPAGVYTLTVFANSRLTDTAEFEVRETPVGTSLTLDKSSVSITAESTCTLKATLQPTDSGETVLWKSSDNAKVAVDGNGRLTAKAVSSGTIITAYTESGLQATCSVTVTYASMTMSSDTITLTVDENSTLNVTLPEGYTGSQVIWEATGSYISLSPNGDKATVTAVSRGSSIVSATVGSLYEADCIVTVVDKPLPTEKKEFKFSVKMETDWDKADWGTSGFSEDDLRSGIPLKGIGTNAGEALENACDTTGIPNEFISKRDGNNNDLRYWVVQIFGLGDVPLEGGDWKYWVQEHNGVYNQKTLGWYEDNSGTYSLTYTVTSVDHDNEIKSLRVVTPPSKTEYVVGESFDSTGMVVEAVMAIGEPITITEYETSPKVFSEPGKQNVTLTYRGQSTTVNVNVIEVPELVSIEVTKLPDKTSYYVGEKLDPKGMVVTATMSDGTKAAVDAKVPETVFTSAGEQTVTVSYLDKTASFKVTVEDYQTPEPDEEDVDKVVNPDGSTTTTTTIDKTDSNGNTVKSEEKVTVQEDGSSKGTKTETITDKDGNVTERNTVTETDKDGNVKSESNTTVTRNDGTTVDTKETVEKDKDGSVKTTESTVTSGDKVTESKTTVKADANGNTTGTETESKTTETLKDADGNKTGTMETEIKETVGKDGKSERKESVVAESDDGNVKTETTSKTDKDGNVTAESKTTVKSESKDVGADVIDAALKQSEQTLSNVTADNKKVDKTVEVEVANGTSASLSPEAVKKVSDYGAGLKVSVKEGSIDTDSDVLKNLAKDGKSVELSMEANNRDVLKDKQKDIVGDNHFVNLNALVGGKNVHQLGGKAVITFGYQLKDGESSADLKVFYVDDEGNKTLVDATFANGSFTMTVDHFSVYMVENTAAPAPMDPETPEDDKDEGGISPVLIAGILVVIIAAIAGVVFYMRKN